uniref:Acetylornithine deacetylase (EC) n=1 Tax=uncultured Thiotrichaceae bacterium TaxID=298394 RepID=A0A6S6UCE7_9GAMM|nr:MAG: Acetylornithine deacetylase (EC [uncultured Thiotrichaceae bacterium]
MTLLTETKSILNDLIAFPTVSSESNLALIQYASDQLTALGADVFFDYDETGKKANLFATLGPEIDGGIVLSGHTDVVPVAGQNWSADPFLMREKDGLLYGRGSCDMKGFIAACLAVAPLYASLDLKRPLHFAFSYDEEIGCLGAERLVEVLKQRNIKPAVAIIGEPTNMRVMEGHKGCYDYTTEFTGLEGHASNPLVGVNAVEYAVRYISRLMELGEDLKTRAPEGSRFQPPWTTLQVGRIEGGQAHNIIAGHCTVDWEMRPVQSGDAAYVKDNIREYCDNDLLPAMQAVSEQASIKTTVIAEVVGLEPVAENEAKQIVSELTGAHEHECGVVAFGTEAGLFQEMGMTAVVCGPGSIEQAHKPDEYVSLAQLQSCLDMLVKLGDKLV